MTVNLSQEDELSKSHKLYDFCRELMTHKLPAPGCSHFVYLIFSCSSSGVGSITLRYVISPITSAYGE